MFPSSGVLYGGKKDKSNGQQETEINLGELRWKMRYFTLEADGMKYGVNLVTVHSQFSV